MNLDQQNIIAMLGLQDLPDEKKLVILDKLTDLVQKRLMARMIASLNEADQQKFAAVLDRNDAKATQEYISEHFPEFGQWLTEEIRSVKEELSDVIQV